MKVLIACEFSGIVRDAFAALGHDAWSCDLLDSESYQPVVFASDLPVCECCGEEAFCPIHDSHFADCQCIGPTEDGVLYSGDETKGSRHFKCDVLTILDQDWDLMIAHPPCTYLCSSGLHWNKRRPEREKQTHEAMLFVFSLIDAPIPRIALENPVGCISSNYRKPDQIIQPFQFGHPESKSTCLWLKNLPRLTPTNVLPKPASGRWDNQTASGQNKLAPSETRWADRSRTYTGIAAAMALQWGDTNKLPEISNFQSAQPQLLNL